MSGQVLETAVAPLLSVAGAALRLWSLRAALIGATGTLLLTIAVLGFLATRRTTLALPIRVAVVIAELAIAAGVVAAKLAVH